MQTKIDCPNCGTEIPLELNALLQGRAFQCSNCKIEIALHERSVETTRAAVQKYGALIQGTSSDPQPSGAQLGALSGAHDPKASHDVIDATASKVTEPPVASTGSVPAAAPELPESAEQQASSAPGQQIEEVSVDASDEEVSVDASDNVSKPSERQRPRSNPVVVRRRSKPVVRPSRQQG